MDDLQYELEKIKAEEDINAGFKPCYKWMTFNTLRIMEGELIDTEF